MKITLILHLHTPSHYSDQPRGNLFPIPYSLCIVNLSFRTTSEFSGHGNPQDGTKSLFLEVMLTLSQGKRIFIKDIDHYLLPPSGKPASIAPSLLQVKRGVGTNGVHSNGVNGVHAAHGYTNGHTEVNGASNGVNGANHTNGVNDHSNGHCNGTTNSANSHTNGVHKEPYPYNTPAEPGNPTVMPRELQAQFHWAFLIRDPHYSVPSYLRCTIPPLDDITGFHNYDPLEAGYNELRRHFDYLRETGLVGPRVATRPELSDDAETQSNIEICVVDADDMLDEPAKTIEAFCNSVGLPYNPQMLLWDTEEDHAVARNAFEKWRGFHNDAIESRALEQRVHVSFIPFVVRGLTNVCRNARSRLRSSLMLNGRRSMVMSMRLSFARLLMRIWRITCTSSRSP